MGLLWGDGGDSGRIGVRRLRRSRNATVAMKYAMLPMPATNSTIIKRGAHTGSIMGMYSSAWRQTRREKSRGYRELGLALCGIGVNRGRGRVCLHCLVCPQSANSSRGVTEGMELFCGRDWFAVSWIWYRGHTMFFNCWHCMTKLNTRAQQRQTKRKISSQNIPAGIVMGSNMRLTFPAAAQV